MGLKARMQGFGLSNKANEEAETIIKEDELLAPEKPVVVSRPPLVLKTLTPLEMGFKETIHSKLLDILDLSLISGIDDKEARKQIRQVAQKLINEESMPLNAQAQTQIIKSIEDDVLGLGPLEALLYDPTISDIMVNGCNQVYVERFGKLELTPIRFNNDSHLMRIIDRIVSRVGRRIDESSPMVDAR